MSALTEYYTNLLESCEDTQLEYEIWLASTFNDVNPESEETDSQHKEK